MTIREGVLYVLVMAFGLAALLVLLMGAVRTYRRSRELSGAASGVIRAVLPESRDG